MFLPRSSLDAAIELPGRTGNTVRGEGVNAWESFAVIDLLLLVTALAAIALAVLAVTGGRAASRWRSQ